MNFWIGTHIEYRILFHSSSSPSNVDLDKNFLMSTHKNNPALPFKHSIPASSSPETSISFLFFNIFWSSFTYLLVNFSFTSIFDSKNWVCEETRPKLTFLWQYWGRCCCRNKSCQHEIQERQGAWRDCRQYECSSIYQTFACPSLKRLPLR